MPDWDPETADASECRALLQAVSPDMEGEITTEALRAAASALWLVLSVRYSEHMTRAGETTDAVEQRLGHFLDDGQSVTLARVLYPLNPSDLDTVLGWPLWRTVEWLAIRAIEADFKAENEALARLN